MYELHPTDQDVGQAWRVVPASSFWVDLRALSRERRSVFTDDLISELTLVVDEGERFTEDELIGTVRAPAQRRP